MPACEEGAGIQWLPAHGLDTVSRIPQQLYHAVLAAQMARADGEEQNNGEIHGRF